MSKAVGTAMTGACRWTSALRAAGTPEKLMRSWDELRAVVSRHQALLRANGIGVEVSDRDRVRVNARRVGLEAPPFADEQASSMGEK